MRFVYCDESVFKNGRVGYGLLATDREVRDKIVKDALAQLEADPDRFKKSEKDLDDATLARGYFHASDDSKNAHSHWCTAIREAFSGEASCTFVDPATTHHPFSPYQLTAMLSSIRALETRDPVHVIAENRTGLSIAVLEQWHADLKRDLLKSVYDNPFLPTYFPSTTFEIRDKSDPGIQCADFILWALNRKVNGDDRWVKRLAATLRIEAVGPTAGDGSLDLHLKDGISEPEQHYDIADWPTRDIATDDTIKAYFHAEHLVSHLRDNDLPAHVKHFQPEFSDVLRRRPIDTEHDYILKLAILYVKLFDMLPLVSATHTRREKQDLLLLRKCMALVVRTDLTNGTRVRLFLNKFRKKVMREQPELLEPGPVNR